jgi:hypothetical protein
MYTAETWKQKQWKQLVSGGCRMDGSRSILLLHIHCVLWPHSPPPPAPEVWLCVSECMEQRSCTLWRVASAGMAGLSEPELPVSPLCSLHTCIFFNTLMNSTGHWLLHCPRSQDHLRSCGPQFTSKGHQAM